MVAQLDSRKSNGISVEILFTDARDGEIWLHVEDSTGEIPETLKRVPNSEASFAFDHPMLYV